MKKACEKINENLQHLKLGYFLANYEREIQEAARKQFSPLQVLERLVEGEFEERHQRSVQRKIRNARLPVLKTLDEFNWLWPKSINRDLIQNLFRLKFIKQKENVVFIGGVGLGKTHLGTALAYEACQQGYNVRFATAVDIINTLSVPVPTESLARRLKQYTAPDLLIIDELGYLPVGKKGADLLFQVISARYERGSVIITTNRGYKDWPKTFDNDATITSAVLDRVLHHCETVVIEGRSYRMKNRLE